MNISDRLYEIKFIFLIKVCTTNTMGKLVEIVEFIKSDFQNEFFQRFLIRIFKREAPF